MRRPRISRRGGGMSGLPRRMPKGERVLWQGSPDWRALARRVLHVRKLLVYLGLMLCWFVASSLAHGHAPRVIAGVACLALLGAAAIGILLLFAWLVCEATVYTITERRIVMRVGIALSLSLNLPLCQIDAAGLRLYPDGSGDIPLRMHGRQTLGYFVLWPHVRPWRMRNCEPMLRTIPDAAKVARLLSGALAASAAQPVQILSDAPAEAAPSVRIGDGALA